MNPKMTGEPQRYSEVHAELSIGLEKLARQSVYFEQLRNAFFDQFARRGIALSLDRDHGRDIWHVELLNSLKGNDFATPNEALAYAFELLDGQVKANQDDIPSPL